jgi:hypothetical protein
MQPGHDGADRNVEHGGDLLVVHALEADEEDHLALGTGQEFQATCQVAHFQGALLRRRGCHLRAIIAQLLIVITVPALTLIVDVNIVQNGKHPRPDVGARLPEMAARQSSHQSFLHQVISPHRVREQRSGITPELRDLFCNQVFGIRHNPLVKLPRQCTRPVVWRSPIDFTEANTGTWHVIPLWARCDRLDSLSVFPVARLQHPAGADAFGPAGFVRGDDPAGPRRSLRVGEAGKERAMGRCGRGNPTPPGSAPADQRFCRYPVALGRSQLRCAAPRSAMADSRGQVPEHQPATGLSASERTPANAAREHQRRRVALAHLGAARWQLTPPTPSAAHAQAPARRHWRAASCHSGGVLRSCHWPATVIPSMRSVGASMP